MPYTIDASTADCHENSTVLINRFGIRSQPELDAVEAALVSAKAVQWEESPSCTSFDFAHYKAIHRHLFGDLYTWAGTIRTVDISKKGTQFCPAKGIARLGDAIFKRLAEKDLFLSLSKASFVVEITDLYERTNELHPFREGNGRTQRVFLSQLAQNAGYRLDFTRVDPDELMIATIQAANGMDDNLRRLLFAIIAQT